MTSASASSRATSGTDGSQTSSSLSSSSISCSAGRKESCSTSTTTSTVADDVFTSQDSSDGKENIPQSPSHSSRPSKSTSGSGSGSVSTTAQIQIPSSKVFTSVLQRQHQQQQGQQHQDHEEPKEEAGEEEDGRWISRSVDSILSSSLGAEQRLLKEMGWKEEDDLYEPLTEDEVREFQDLVMARAKSVNGSSLLPSPADLMTSSKNWRNVTGSWFRSRRTMDKESVMSPPPQAAVRPPPSQPQLPVSASGRKSVNSGLASPQFNDERSSSSDDSSSDDEEEEDLVMGRVTAALTGSTGGTGARFPHRDPIS